MRKWLILAALAGLCSGTSCLDFFELGFPVFGTVTPAGDASCDPFIDPFCGGGLVAPCDPRIDPLCDGGFIGCDPLIDPFCDGGFVSCDPLVDPFCDGGFVGCNTLIDPFCF